MSRNETEAPEEVLNGLLVKQVVLNAVLSLVQQPSLLGDEVPDEESTDKVLTKHWQGITFILPSITFIRFKSKE